MNKLAGMGVIVVLLLVALCGYWYMNPHHVPRYLRSMIPEVDGPPLKSPMKNFRPPQF